MCISRDHIVQYHRSVDTSEEAVRARTEELGTGVTSLTLTDDLEKPMGERLDIFAKYVMAKKTLPKFPAKEVVGMRNSIVWLTVIYR